MVLGNSMSVMLELEIDISQLGKLATSRRVIEQFEKDVNSAARDMNSAAGAARNMSNGIVLGSDRASRSMRELRMRSSLIGDEIDNAAVRGRIALSQLRASLAKTAASAKKVAASMAGITGSIQALRIAMLNLMFTGLNLAFVFGGILALSPRIRAGFSAIVGALRLVAIEAGKILGPELMDLAKTIRNLDSDQKKFLARLAIAGTLLGITAGLVGVLGGALVSFGGMIIKAGSALFSLAKVLLGPLIGAVSGATVSIAGLSVPMWAVLAAGAALFAFFMKFQTVRKVVAAVVKSVSSTLIALKNVFTGLVVPILKRGLAGLELAFKEFYNVLIDNGQKVLNFFDDLISRYNQLASEVPGMDRMLNPFDNLSGMIEDAKINTRDLRNHIKGLNEEDISIADVFNDTSQELTEMDKIVDGIFKPDAGTLGIGEMAGMLASGTGDLALDALFSQVPVSRQGISSTTNDLFTADGATNQNIENNVTMEEPVIEENVDVDRLMDDIEERLERNQRRSKNTL